MSKQTNNFYEGFGPLQNRMLVEPEAAETKTAGGIILPGKEGETINQGKVLAVGPDVIDRKVGDRVLYGQYSGFEVTIGVKKYRLIREEDAYAILSNK